MLLFFFPRVEGRGVAEICAVARGDRGSMTDGHGVDKAVPERLGLALDFGAVLQFGPDQGRIRIPVHDESGKFLQELSEASGDFFPAGG